MPENREKPPRKQDLRAPPPTADEGGLRAPPGLGSWAKAWWWFHFLILVKLARLRFVAILLAIGLVILKWDAIIARYDRWTRPAGSEQAALSEFEYYCPMHPMVIRDNPRDKCPICLMSLDKRKKADSKAEALPPGIVNRVELSPYRIVQAGLRTWTVSYEQLTKEIATVGSVEFNERLMKQITARVKGRIDQLFVNETGQMVHKGQELASLYSSELVSTMRDLLGARASKNAGLQRIAEERLELWGISRDQIDEILATGKANTHLKIRSPIDGHVLRKYVKEGQSVEEGSPLYDVVDLGSVWIQAQVYEEDMAFLPFYHHALKAKEAKEKGMPVTATTRAFPGHVFEGHLTFVYPHVDQDTRTVIARFELPNPGHKLRPGTSATVNLKVPPRQVDIFSKVLEENWAKQNAAQGAIQRLFALGGPNVALDCVHPAGKLALLNQGFLLAVPDSAVIDTGSMQIVYREVVPGEYEGVKVELGPRLTGQDDAPFFPVLAGLQAGDKVVAVGAFLIDAETRLNPAAGSIYFGGSAGSKGMPSTNSAVKPSTPDDLDAKVKAGLAKLTSEDRRLAKAQGFCPVREDNRLGSMGVPVKLMIEMQPVFLCCRGCVKEAMAETGVTVGKVQRLKARMAAGSK